MSKDNLAHFFLLFYLEKRLSSSAPSNNQDPLTARPCFVRRKYPASSFVDVLYMLSG